MTAPEQNPTPLPREHSPLPWSVAGFAGEHDESGARIVDAEGRHILHTWGHLREASPLSEWRRYHADPAFIVDAVNGYAALQERLEAAEAECARLNAERNHWSVEVRLLSSALMQEFDGLLPVGDLMQRIGRATAACFALADGAGEDVTTFTDDRAALRARAEAAERLNGELVTALRELHRQIDPLDDPSCPACGMSFMHDDLCSYTAAQALLARIEAESSPKEPNHDAG